MSYDIRPMTRADLDVALDWARDEGWNPGLDDAGPFYAQDPTGFLMGWFEGEPIASISVVKYAETFAFLGLYIVRPQWRGKGHGKAIWDAGIASAGARTIGLDGVVAQQDNYRKSGFVLAHRSARWGGVSQGGETDPKVRAIGVEDLTAIRAIDAQHFPADRERFLAEWIGQSSTRRTVAYVDGAQILGYATMRRSNEGHKIGPLFATTARAAEAMFAALLSEAKGESVFIDIPWPNEPAADMARAAGLTPSFETARMYRGDAPLLPLDQIAGITSLELG